MKILQLVLESTKEIPPNVIKIAQAHPFNNLFGQLGNSVNENKICHFTKSCQHGNFIPLNSSTKWIHNFLPWAWNTPHQFGLQF